VLRDVATHILGNAVLGYIVVFAVETILLLVAILLFLRVDVTAFRRRAEELSTVERITHTVG
jgi:hypothetical protein